MTKILLISPTSGGQSGVGRHVLSLSKKLVEHGNDVSTLTTENIFYIDLKGLRNLSFAFFSALKAQGAKYDVIHAHNVPSAIPMKVGCGRKVLTIHGYYSGQIKLLHGGVIGKLSNFLEPKMLTWADVITVVSKSAQEAYQEIGIDTVYIPNAIDQEGLPSGEERLYDSQIIFVGRLSKEKNLDLLIQAKKALNDLNLILVGSGPEENRLKKYAKNDKIHFIGKQPWERTIRLIRGSDALVLPSKIEGIPTVLLEAMSVGTPVIATRVGGIPEIIEHRKNGLLVPVNNVKRLIESIDSITGDKKLGIILTKNAKKKIEKTYSWNVVFPKYLEVYQKMID